MCTARLPTIRISVATARGRVCPQVNNFEQVSSDDHQMSVAGKGVGVPSPMSGGRGKLVSIADSISEGTLPCDLSHHVPLPWTDACENITNN